MCETSHLSKHAQPRLNGPEMGKLKWVTKSVGCDPPKFNKSVSFPSAFRVTRFRLPVLGPLNVRGLGPRPVAAPQRGKRLRGASALCWGHGALSQRQTKRDTLRDATRGLSLLSVLKLSI